MPCDQYVTIDFTPNVAIFYSSWSKRHVRKGVKVINTNQVAPKMFAWQKSKWKSREMISALYVSNNSLRVYDAPTCWAPRSLRQGPPAPWPAGSAGQRWPPPLCKNMHWWNRVFSTLLPENLISSGSKPIEQKCSKMLEVHKVLF